jgi:ureidoglycolate lyase
MTLLRPQPLAAANFAAFGEVIECAGAKRLLINGGTTERFHDLARIDPGPAGRAIVSIFRGQPREFPLTISMVERHPLGSQAFVPLQARPYLVVVAESDAQSGLPGALHAFVAQGGQGVNYAPGVWHHPLIAVGAVSDFLVIDRQGDGANCDELALAKPVSLLFAHDIGPL